MKRAAWLLITLSAGVLVGLLAVTVVDGFRQRDRAVSQQDRTIDLLEREVERAQEARRALGADLDDANRKLDELHAVVEALVAQLAEEGEQPKVSIPPRTTTRPAPRPRSTTTTAAPKSPPEAGADDDHKVHGGQPDQRLLRGLMWTPKFSPTAAPCSATSSSSSASGCPRRSRTSSSGSRRSGE